MLCLQLKLSQEWVQSVSRLVALGRIKPSFLLFFGGDFVAVCFLFLEGQEEIVESFFGEGRRFVDAACVYCMFFLHGNMCTDMHAGISVHCSSLYASCT